MKEKQFLFENIAAKILISKAAKNRTLVLEARIESEFYLSLRRGIRSFWKRMVRKGRERERERACITIFTRLPSRSQCHGPMEPPGNADDPTTRASRNVSVRASLGPGATTKPVRSHVSDHHSVLKQY